MNLNSSYLQHPKVLVSINSLLLHAIHLPALVLMGKLFEPQCSAQAHLLEEGCRNLSKKEAFQRNRTVPHTLAIRDDRTLKADTGAVLSYALISQTSNQTWFSKIYMLWSTNFWCSSELKGHFFPFFSQHYFSTMKFV